MFLGELPEGLIGADPKYPKIVDHSWLEVDAKEYDNYPSDNNPVRVVPKLADLWNHECDKGANLIPNAITIPLKASTENEKKSSDAILEIVRETKKAMMSGLKGSNLAGHLRSRFAVKHLEAAKEPLAKLSAEQGLIGNVYIDASAFSSFSEAEQFLTMHRNRLAQDIIVNKGILNASLVSTLASKFRKNVVADIDYKGKILDKYKNHLVASGHIDSNFVIDSKETLRAAFMHEKEEAPRELFAAAAKKEKSLSGSEISEKIAKIAESKKAGDIEAQDQLLIPEIKPVLEFTQEHLAKGKDAAALKEMLRSKFVAEDITASAKGLAVIASSEGLTVENVDGLVEAGKISEAMGDELKRIGKKFPVKAKTAPELEKKTERLSDSKEYLYHMGGKQNSDGLEAFREASLKALQHGIDPEKVMAKLSTKISPEQASQVIIEAVRNLNAQPAGMKANTLQKPEKVPFQETEKAVNFGLFASQLPEASGVLGDNNELVSFFDGSASMDIEVNATQEHTPLEVDSLLSRDGIDSAL